MIIIFEIATNIIGMMAVQTITPVIILIKDEVATRHQNLQQGLYILQI